MAPKKTKLEDPAISEILVADTGTEAGAEARELEDKSEEEQEASAQEDEPQATTSGEGLTIWGPPQGRNKNIHSFVGQAQGLKNSEAPHIKQDSSPT